MEKDLSLPPNRPRPKGGNFRKKPKGENRAAAPAKGKKADAAIPTGFWLAALGLGLVLAYVSTAEASPGTGGDTAQLPTPTGPPTAAPEPAIIIQSGTRPSAKPARRPLVPAQRPLVYVYIDSVGGEGIFDRLKTADSLIDGHGLDRVASLANGEFAGYYTGKFWAGAQRSNGTTPTYLQLYQLFDGRHYNYWVDAEEVKQFHAPGAQVFEGWKAGFQMTPTTKQLIASWYAAHYA